MPGARKAVEKHTGDTTVDGGGETHPEDSDDLAWNADHARVEFFGGSVWTVCPESSSYC